MKFRAIILSTLLLLAASLPAVPSYAREAATINPSEYWLQNSDVQYNVYEITGKISYTTMLIALDPVTANDYIGNISIASGPFDGGGYYSTFHVPTQPYLPIDMNYTHINDLYNEGGRCFWGESGNAYTMDIWPPEPKITCNPVAGEVFDIYSSIDGGPANFRTRYKTQSVSPVWGAFTNVVVTSLVEFHGTPRPQWGAMYAFSKDSGTMVYMAYGSIDAQRNVVGHLYYQNPWP